jgi:hypothetical protein
VFRTESKYFIVVIHMTSSSSTSDNEVASNRSGLEEDVNVGGQATVHVTDLKSTDVLLGKDPNVFYVDRAYGTLERPALTRVALFP